MRALAILILWLLVVPAVSQTASTERADSLKNAGDVYNAFLAYRAIHEQNPNDGKNTYQLATMAALMYNPMGLDTAFRYMKKALSGDSSIYVIMDSQLFHMTTDARWESLKNNQVDKYEAKNGAIRNREFAEALWLMVMRDQAFRYFQRQAEREIMNGGPVNPMLYPLTYFGEVEKSKNLALLEELIAKYGWPKRSEFPEVTADVAALIINHSNHETRLKYLPTLIEMLEIGEVDALSYAKIHDRILVDEGKGQLYGTQQHFLNGKLWPEEIHEPSYVDERRKEIGLGALAPYLKKRFGIDWNIDQKNN